MIFLSNRKKLGNHRFLIADMCFHQVMAECMYHVFSNLGETHILAHETTMAWPSNIPANHILLKNKIFRKIGFIQRRMLRLKFLITLLRISRNYSHIIVTTGIEYAPKGIKLISYVMYYLLCLTNKRVITVVHNTNFWEDDSGFFRAFLVRRITSSVKAFACLSNRVHKRWRSTISPANNSFVLPFLTIDQNHISKQMHSKASDVITLIYQGTVNYKRKDCDLILSTFRHLSDQKRSKYKIIFQGPPIYTEDMLFLSKLSALVECDWREYYLPHEEMRKLLLGGDIFISPLKSSYGYGQIKESGIAFDCIKYQRPGIVRGGLCSDEFSDFLLSYSSATDFFNLLNTLDRKILHNLYNNLIHTSSFFTHSYCASNIREHVLGDSDE